MVEITKRLKMDILEHKMLFINVFAVISRITNTLHPEAIFYEDELQLISEIKKQIDFDCLPLLNECANVVSKPIKTDERFIALGNAVVSAVEDIELSSEYEKFILSFDNANQNIALATLLRMTRKSNRKHKVFLNNEHIHTLTGYSADALHGILATIDHDSEDEDFDLENNNRFTIIPRELERHQELLEKEIIKHEEDNFYRLNKNAYEYKAEHGGSFFNSL